MNARTPTSATPSRGKVGTPPLVQGSPRTPARTAPGRSSPINPGAVEYASWLRLLHRPAP